MVLSPGQDTVEYPGGILPHVGFLGRKVTPRHAELMFKPLWEVARDKKQRINAVGIIGQI